MRDIKRSERQKHRYGTRRTEILEAASREINLNGVRGMTLTSVARSLGLDTSSVSYYFKRKDVLAAACLERTLEWLRAAALTAARQPTVEEGVRSLVAAALTLHARQRDEESPRLALLSDLGALDDEARAPLDATSAEAFAAVRAIFAGASRRTSLIAANSLLAIVHWMPAWIGQYHLMDFDRVERLLVDLVLHGWRTPMPARPVDRRLLAQDAPADAQGRFIHAATELINRNGYHGASVERIASHLNVSVGSFYHHLDNKDDLVIACFERSFRLIEAAFALGPTQNGYAADSLGTVAENLLAIQFEGTSPLLRMGAYQALPLTIRSDMLLRFTRLTMHLAGIFDDVRAETGNGVPDATLAAHVFMSVIMAASDIRFWASDHTSAATAEYIGLLSVGVQGANPGASGR